MFQKVLIANRGEIAARIARTCRRLGVTTVGVHSEADAGALHTPAVDESHLVGPAPVKESYLNVAAILDAAKRSGAQAVHPGYGLLSEKSHFARAVRDAGLVWIGPPPEALDRLRVRLDRAYRGAPHDHPVDRAFAAVVAIHGVPRAIPEALLEGFAWDVEGRSYDDLSGVLAYSARVASAVGVMMTVLMGRREPGVLARACDLGAAMQLTNIARDVGEDARNGRVYLPGAWLREAGVDVEAWRAKPTFTPAIGAVTERLLKEADKLYVRADLGVPMLPRDCRPAIRAARLLYADIGRVVRARGGNSVDSRAVVSKGRKLALVIRAWGARFSAGREPQAGDAPALPEVQFLLDAVAGARALPGGTA
jgi:phytoene synthase